MSSSSSNHKFQLQRSIHGSHIEISKMRQLSTHLALLKEDLKGVEETELELDAVIEHVNALERIINTAPKSVQKVPFSSVTKSDLTNLGVLRGHLIINPTVLQNFFWEASPETREEISHLGARIRDVYGGVNIGNSKVNTKPNSDPVILPHLNLTSPDVGLGVKVVSNATGYELYLSGSVDLALLRYNTLNEDHRDRLLTPGLDTDDIFKFARISGGDGLFLVVEVTPPCNTEEDITPGLHAHRPRAVSQAMAVSVVCRLQELRFCITSGTLWLFCLLRKEDGVWVYYESPHRSIGPSTHQAAITCKESKLSETLILLTKWIEDEDDLVAELYHLERMPKIE